MIRFIGRAWRRHLGDIVAEARRSVLIVVPFVKHTEAVWLCANLRSGVHLTTLANIDADAVSTSALDIAGLQHLAEAPSAADLIVLSSLHAKVFVVDDSAAIVTSGNLTRAGLDRNIEYGVLLRKPELVRTVRQDMMLYARLGSRVSPDVLAQLIPLERELRRARTKLDDSGSPVIKRQLNRAMKRAKPAFASAQVGNRTPHAVFGDAIQFILEGGPQSTAFIKHEVKHLLPTLCDDNDYFYIKGERYGKTWMRRLRHAQQHLKKQGVVTYDRSTKTWALTQA